MSNEGILSILAGGKFNMSDTIMTDLIRHPVTEYFKGW